MAKVKFEKGSYYWRLFMDFWKLCQEYWEPDDTEAWWDEVDAATRKFVAVYDNRAFPRMLAQALIAHLEEQKKKREVSGNGSKKPKTPYGKYSKQVLRFYDLDKSSDVMVYESTIEAFMAQKGMLKALTRRGIYDVRVKRRKNVIYLERTDFGKGQKTCQG